MSLRPLWETLVELTEAVRPTGAAADMVRVTKLDISLPIELSLRTLESGEIELGADAPRWRWTSPFDQQPSRLSVELVSYLEQSGLEKIA